MATPLPATVQSSPTPAPPRRRRLRWLLGVMGVLVLVVLCVALVVFQRWHREPADWSQWHQTLASADPQQRETLTSHAMAVEQRAMQLFNVMDDQGRPLGQGDGLGLRTLELTPLEANCWLSLRLPELAATQSPVGQVVGSLFPPELTDPMVSVEDGHLVLRARYAAQELSQIFSMTLATGVPSPGELTVRIEKMRGGDLPLPAAAIQRQLENRAKYNPADPLANMGELFAGKKYPATWTIDGQRTATLQSLTVTSEKITVAFNLTRTPGR